MNQTLPTPAVEISVHEDTAVRRYSTIEIQKQKIKEKRAMLKDAFENDATYRIAMEAVEEQKKKLKEVKEQVAQQPAIVQLKMEIKDMQAELKEEQIALFEDLEAYTRTSGATTIEINGKVKKIVKNYKVVNAK